MSFHSFTAQCEEYYQGLANESLLTNRLFIQIDNGDLELSPYGINLQEESSFSNDPNLNLCRLKEDGSPFSNLFDKICKPMHSIQADFCIGFEDFGTASAPMDFEKIRASSQYDSENSTSELRDYNFQESLNQTQEQEQHSSSTDSQSLLQDEGALERRESPQIIEIPLKEIKQICQQSQQLKLHNRKDIIFKHIIREMRKFFKVQFNSVTNYKKKKRRKNCEFIENCLQRYANHLFSELNSEIIKLRNQTNGEAKQNLKFLMGSMFYPKDYKKTHSDNQSIQTIDKIHKAFHNFSIGKIDVLAEFESFNFLLEYYLELCRSGKISRSPHNKSKEQDYQLAYEFLDGVYSDQSSK